MFWGILSNSEENVRLKLDVVFFLIPDVYKKKLWWYELEIKQILDSFWDDYLNYCKLLNTLLRYWWRYYFYAFFLIFCRRVINNKYGRYRGNQFSVDYKSGFKLWAAGVRYFPYWKYFRSHNILTDENHLWSYIKIFDRLLNHQYFVHQTQISERKFSHDSDLG